MDKPILENNNDGIKNALREPTPKDRVKFRAGHTNHAKTKASMLAYIDARFVQDRLDDIVGSDNWDAEYMVINSILFCTIIVHWPDGQVTHKSDCGAVTDFEKEKGQASDAFKRAAVHYGIGRDLYGYPNHWADCNENGYVEKNWTPPGWGSSLNVIPKKGSANPPESHPEPSGGPNDPGDENGDRPPTTQELADRVTAKAALNAPAVPDEAETDKGGGMKEGTPPENDPVMVSDLIRVTQSEKAVLFIPADFDGDKGDPNQTRHFWLPRQFILDEATMMNGRCNITMPRWIAESPKNDGSPKYTIDELPF